MEKNRLEAFSDGVLAIIITIMVLDLKVPQPTEQLPHPDTLAALKPLLPVFLTYVLSFIYLGIYWNNHHHLLKAAHKVNGAMMWANLHLLFWLSLFPFVTGWLGENHFTTAPAAIYGAVLLMAAIAWYILQTLIIARQGRDSKLAKAIGRDFKGKISPLLYATGIALAFFRPWISCTIYALVALLWLVPDRRIERVVEESPDS
ncbi:MAG TPA: TMEM175 family protein [Candidatus Aquilonibacter sp.]|nr:TMEM175 family protein [Candidatus Aquilonibacter sp.]